MSFPTRLRPARPGTASDPPAYSEWAGVGAGGRADGDYNLEAFVSEETTLAGHLTEQVALAFADPAERMIAQYLVDLVDEAGYLTGDLADAPTSSGRRSGSRSVLARLQTLDPPGVCARNLDRMPRHPAARPRPPRSRRWQALLENLELLAKRDFAALRKFCGVDDEDLIDMIAEIKHLNPKPGLAFGTAVVQPIVPDVFVRQAATARGSSN